MKESETDVSLRISRRGLIAAGASFALPGLSSADNAKNAATMGIPGPYRGTVIEIAKREAVENTHVDSTAVRSMLSTGMKQLTGGPGEGLAWKSSSKPGGTLGIRARP